MTNIVMTQLNTADFQELLLLTQSEGLTLEQLVRKFIKAGLKAKKPVFVRIQADFDGGYNDIPITKYESNDWFFWHFGPDRFWYLTHKLTGASVFKTTSKAIIEGVAGSLSGLGDHWNFTDGFSKDKRPELFEEYKKIINYWQTSSE